ncbi:class I lanthipeptide [Pedobacter gandavensis]|uniref:class I lanthipeptide n=1 Tax=Pedobacter TaxID=84567 RepID=UPI001C9A04D3|nr:MULTISPECIES: class I lanthipeptide [Pedobacter]WGQ09195.1 class I lanthipeptide [Pedobacter gandavensis]
MKKFKKLTFKKEEIANLDRKSLSKVLGGIAAPATTTKPYENSSGITLCSANPFGCGGYSGC